MTTTCSNIVTKNHSCQKIRMINANKLIRMKSEKLKRNFWVSAEIECMLNLIKEFKAEQSMTPSTTTQATFTNIAKKMKKRGLPNKSPTQIRRKWFQMKSAYLCYKKGKLDRLFLIPEKFRSTIAQLVDTMDKVPPGLAGLANKGNSTLGGPMVKPATALTAPMYKAPATLAAAPIHKAPPAIAVPPLHKMSPNKTATTLSAATIHKPTSSLAAPYNMARLMKPEATSTKAPPKPATPLDKFMAKIEQNNSQLCSEFQKLQESLFQYEVNCQTTRDYNILKYLSV